MRTSLKLLSIALLPFALAVCVRKKVPAQEPVASVTAPPPPVAPAASAPTADALVGSWSGKIDGDQPISFAVEGNQVTSVSANYAGRNGTCSFNGGFSSDGPVAIDANKSFTAQGNSEGKIQFTATGTFANGEASGTIVWKGKSDLCGDFDMKGNWTAKKEAQ